MNEIKTEPGESLSSCSVGSVLASASTRGDHMKYGYLGITIC